MATEIDYDETAKKVAARTNHDHSVYCAWHSVMTNVENYSEDNREYDDEFYLIEDALCLIDGYCQCDRTPVVVPVTNQLKVTLRYSPQYKYSFTCYSADYNRRLQEEMKTVKDFCFGSLPIRFRPYYDTIPTVSIDVY